MTDLVISSPGTGSGDGCHVRSLWAFRSFDNVESHLLALTECLEPVLLNRGVVDEDVLALHRLNEAIPFGIIEPLHLPVQHFGGPPRRIDAAAGSAAEPV